MHAFIAIGRRRRGRESAELLAVNTTAARGDEKAIKRMLAEAAE